MKMLKKGDRGEEVKRLQRLLGITADGIFGDATRRAVVRFQMNSEITVDGVVGNETWTLLMTNGMNNDAIDEDTDGSSRVYTTRYNQVIHQYYLPKDEYVHKTYKNEYVMLHHTAGGANPFACVDMWARDTRGRVGTEFVLGGQNHRNGNDEYDGVMVQAFPQGNLAWHIGRSGSGYMNRRTVGLEICSMGYLDNELKTYVGTKAAESQVAELEEAFRGHMHWHRYSDKQIQEIEKWIRYIGERDGVDITLGLKQLIKRYGPVKAFGFQEDAYYGKIKGLLSHTNVRRDKSDVYPDPRLVDVIMSL